MQRYYKKIGFYFLRGIASCALMATVLSVNTPCWTFMYQDDLPEIAMRFKKIEQ